MPYAHRDDIYDADTHMMERPDWIADFADPDIRPWLAPFVGGNPQALSQIEDAMRRFALRRADAGVVASDEAAFMAMRYKGWHGLGAFDAAERVRANDLLGFKAHIVFPTSAFDQVIAASRRDVLIGGVRALNRGLAAFCSADPRMLGAAYLPLGLGPELAAGMLEELIRAGFRIVVVDTVPPRDGLSFTHPDYDGIWARIQEANLAVTLHVGVNGRWFNPVPASLYANGRSRPAHVEGDAPRDALAYMSIQHEAQLFLAALIFDGVLEKFPGLRIGIIELGASWIVSWMKQLDQAYRAFRRLQDLSGVKLQPSDYVRRQMKITPFPGEDIGWLLSSGAEDLLMFASDYPHHEGTDDPIGRFERTMEGIDEVRRKRFYAGNFRELLGMTP